MLTNRREEVEVDDDALSAEVERTLRDYSEAWEGHPEEVRAAGAGVARWNGQSGFAIARFAGPNVDEQLAESIELLEGSGRRYAWVVGPHAEPADLEERLMSRGFTLAFAWDGLVLDELDIPIDINPEVVIEEPRAEDADEVGELWEVASDGHFPRHFAAESLRRYVSAQPKEAQIFLGRLDGKIVSYTTTRFEPNGTAYLRQGGTHPAYRQRGLYLTLLARRLESARDAGCVRAVVQAITTTSSPILQKRGFRRVCGLSAYMRSSEAT
jgi:N-acetylglutamate synthase-like GNAT family acetyltransferase